MQLFWLRGKDLNQRPPGYEPDELPTALPRDIELFATCNWAGKFGAGNRARTDTRFKSHGILSPGRLPIPPLRHLVRLIILPHEAWNVNRKIKFLFCRLFFRVALQKFILKPLSKNDIISWLLRNSLIIYLQNDREDPIDDKNSGVRDRQDGIVPSCRPQ